MAGGTSGMEETRISGGLPRVMHSNQAMRQTSLCVFPFLAIQEMHNGIIRS